MSFIQNSIVLLYHTKFQNLPQVHKADILAHANQHYAQASDILQKSDNIVLYQEKRAVVGLAALERDKVSDDVIHLSMMCVNNRFQKSGIGTEMLTYVFDELQGPKQLRASIPPLRWNHAELVRFFEKRNFQMAPNDSDTTLLIHNAM